MNQAASPSEQTARRVFWIIMAAAAAFVAMVLAFMR